MEKVDVLKRAYATLGSLKQNFPANVYVHEKYVSEYHRVIQSLETEGFDLKEFRIPELEVKHRRTSYSSYTNEKTYSKSRYVEKTFF